MQISKLFASLHYKTLLVELNVKNPQIQRWLENGSRGLMEFLRGEVPLDSVVFQPSENIHFDIIALGKESGNEFVLKEEDLLKIKKLTDRYECVVVDTAGLLDSAFVHPLLKEADEVFLVLLLSKTTEEDLAKCKEILDTLQVKRLSVVLNGFNKKIHSLEM